MVKIPFNVDAYTARLIGRENVSKLNGAVLELVKNTYDADAAVCFIYYDDESECLYIGDNGVGMSANTIIENWMTIGRSTKKTKYMSDSGRVQTGAKGIGRFALDRIADLCTMLSISTSENLLWSVDWRDFEGEGAITEVVADLNKTDQTFLDFISTANSNDVKQFVSDNFSKHGTIFRLSLLRDIWNQVRMDEIRKELSTLIPNELSKIFNVYLFDNKASAECAAVLHSDDSFSFDYKIVFDVKEGGEAQVRIWRDEFDFGSRFDYIIKNAGFSNDDEGYFTGRPIEYNTTFSELITKDTGKVQNTIGSFNGILYFAKLQLQRRDRKKFYYKEIPDRRNFGESFGGIKIYRDQFRVRPYGEPKTSNADWLQLSSRKNKSPAAISHPTGAWRVSGDQMLGAIYISRANITLPDQANREGIVETPEFRMLKELLISVIQLFERDRQYVCRKLNELYERETQSERYRKEIEDKAKAEAEAEERANQHGGLGMSENLPDTMVFASKAQLVIEAKETIIRNLEDENRLLRVLATTGIATNAYIHEFKEQTHKLSMKIIMAKEALEYDNDQPEALRQLDEADQIRNSFTSWFRVTVESVRRDKRSLKVVNLNEFIAELCDAWEQVVQPKKINIEFTGSESPIFYRCFPYEIEIILNNLITNSAAIFNTLKGFDKRICISLLDTPDSISLQYFDTGPGLASSYKKNPELILEPFESDKIDDSGEIVGTGMGMWLIKRTVFDYNGSIDLSKNKREQQGFFCKIVLPK